MECVEQKEFIQAYQEGVRAGIEIAFAVLKQRLPELFDNIQYKLSVQLDPVKDVIH